MSDVVLSRSGAVAHVMLNRPEALNAWTPDMGRSLLAVLREVGADPAVRAVVLTGAGRAFSAGADVKVPREYLPDGSPDLQSRLREIYNPCILEVRRMPKPVVAGIHGAAAGLGASLTLACDLVVAASSAYLLLAFVRIAVIPDGGALPALVARVGPARAAQLAMLGDRLPAATALEWGLVNEVVPDESLLERTLALGERLAGMPTVAVGTMKSVLNEALGGLDRFAELLELEAELQQRQAPTRDYAEGVAAFKEKRPAVFEGR